MASFSCLPFGCSALHAIAQFGVHSSAEAVQFKAVTLGHCEPFVYQCYFNMPADGQEGWMT